MQYFNAHPAQLAVTGKSYREQFDSMWCAPTPMGFQDQHFYKAPNAHLEAWPGQSGYLPGPQRKLCGVPLARVERNGGNAWNTRDLEFVHGISSRAPRNGNRST